MHIEGCDDNYLTKPPEKSPPTGTAQLGGWKVPGGPLSEDDYRKAAQDSGFKGQIIVAKDLASLRLPSK